MALTDEAKIEDIMKHTSLLAYLATCDGDQPRVRPVSPIIKDCTNLWVTTMAASRKVAQLRKNPKMSLAFMEQPRGDKAATVIGEAREITDLEEKKRVWDMANFDLALHFPDGPESENFCVLKIVVEKIEWRDRWEGGLKVYEPVKK